MVDDSKSKETGWRTLLKPIIQEVIVEFEDGTTKVFEHEIGMMSPEVLKYYQTWLEQLKEKENEVV